MAGQYSQAASDAGQYQSQGKVEGYDMAGLISWLSTSTAPVNATTAAAGGASQTLVPGLAGGGVFSGGSPIGVGEQGPEIITPTAPGFVLPNPIVSILNGLINTMPGPPKSSSTGSNIQDPTSSLQLQTHKSLYDITAQRTALEMNVITARQSQMQMEMQYMSMLNDTMNNLQNMAGNSSGTNFEALLQQVYQTRGRYGSANFRRETL